MIEVNLHPSRKGGRGRKGGGRSGLDLSMPDLGDVQFLDRVRSDPWNAAMIGALILVPLLIVFFWLGQRSTEQQLQERLDAALADSARLADLRALSDSLTSREQEIRERIRLVRGLDDNRYVWPHLMDELSSALPARAWLESVIQQSPLPNLEVQVQGNAGSPLIITDFVRNLERAPHVGEVQIVGSNRQLIDGVSTQAFTLNVTYRSSSGSESQQTVSLSGDGS